MLAGAGLVAAATLAGAWLARRRPGQREIWFAAAAGALLIIVGLHLLPDAWSGARAARIWPGLVPLATVAAFTAAGLAARAGCGCQEHKEQASGAGTAAALAIHRFLEGSAMALAGSAAVVVALAAHAFGEGLATGTLLGAQSRRRVAGWRVSPPPPHRGGPGPGAGRADEPARSLPRGCAPPVYCSPIPPRQPRRLPSSRRWPSTRPAALRQVPALLRGRGEQSVRSGAAGAAHIGNQGRRPLDDMHRAGLS